MRKIGLFLLIAILSLGYFFNIANAKNTLPQEAIVYYNSNIIVNFDNSIDVVETIIYDTGPSERHGIYRDIYPYSSQNRKMDIQDVSVTDETDSPYMFQITDSGSNFRIKIGDPDVTFLGQKIYVIRYHATRAIAQLNDLDEIYWNVTGNGWGMPIYQAQASIVLPNGTNMIKLACYFGPKGSTNKCQPANGSYGNYTFNAPSILNPYEGLTIAAGFPKGVMNIYSAADFASNFFDVYWQWMVASILPILSLILSLLNWYRNGRDPRGTGVIVPQYDVPDNLTPMEVVGIANEKVNASNISSEIIYLATKGYLKIRQLEKRFIGLVKSTDYELTRLKDSSDLANNFDQKLLNGLFNVQPRIKILDLKSIFTGKVAQVTDPVPMNQAQVVKLSDLRYVFYRDAATVVTSVLDALLNKGYYKNLGRMKNESGRIFLIAFMSIWASGFFGTILGLFLLRDNPFPLMVGIFFSIIIYGIISHFSPAKTEKGVMVKEYILGLKDYLQIAEKDRLKFHNAPEKRPEVFEKLLPYAMVLGVADIWAKEFEGIYTMPPSWYSGPPGAAFSTIDLSNSMANFSAFATSSLSSSSGQGGSSGGGSSGGGGGGGGGGGW